MSLKQHFVALREHLLVSVVPLKSGEIVMSGEDVENMLQVGGLDKVMQSLLKCVDKLCRASNEEQEKREVGSSVDPH